MSGTHGSTPAPTSDELRAAGLEFSVEGPVAVIVLCAPERRNSQTPAMWRALAALGRSMPDEVRIVILRAEGPSFSAGLDRSMLSDTVDVETVRGLLGGTDLAAARTIGEYQQGFTFLRDPNFISIAAVQGHAVGAGFQLALACDIRIVADDAVFCMKEPALGLVPDLTGLRPLVRQVGYARAGSMCSGPQHRRAGSRHTGYCAERRAHRRPRERDRCCGSFCAAIRYGRCSRNQEALAVCREPGSRAAARVGERGPSAQTPCTGWRTNRLRPATVLTWQRNPTGRQTRPSVADLA